MESVLLYYYLGLSYSRKKVVCLLWQWWKVSHVPLNCALSQRNYYFGQFSLSEGTALRRFYVCAVLIVTKKEKNRNYEIAFLHYTFWSRKMWKVGISGFRWPTNMVKYSIPILWYAIALITYSARSFSATNWVWMYIRFVIATQRWDPFSSLRVLQTKTSERIWLLMKLDSGKLAELRTEVVKAIGVRKKNWSEKELQDKTSR